MVTPDSVRTVMHAADIARTPDGRFVVYADRTQAPSGIGFAIADRRLLSRTYPQLLRSCAPRPMATFAQTLRLALFDYAPPGVDDRWLFLSDILPTAWQAVQSPTMAR